MTGQFSRLMLDWAFAFPDPQIAWKRAVLKQLSFQSEADRPDVIFATGSPWTSLLIGQALGRRYGVPFVVDFRDPWASNADFHYINPALIRKTQDLERKICRDAAAVIANTVELKTHLTHLYPEIEKKCVAISNGFHADDFSLLSTLGERPRSKHLGIEICHFGTMYMMRTPVALLRALVELVRAGQILASQLRLRFVGTWDVRSQECEQLALELEGQGVLRRDAAVGHAECLAQMMEADALLTMQPGSTLQIPAKIYEYIATRRPLVVIGDPGATFNLVQRHQLGICCRNEVQAIKELLVKLAHGSSTLMIPSKETAEGFNYSNLTEQLAKVFDRAVQPTPQL